MSSINPNNINGQYPVAGQDNDSQGFRDNFTNIINNFTFAYNELIDLQQNAVLKNALSGTTISNDMNYAQLIKPQLLNVVETQNPIVGAVSGSKNISWLDGDFQKFTTGADVVLGVTNWPQNGTRAKLRLQITTGANVANITFPTIMSNVGIASIQGFVSGQQIRLDGSGIYQFELSSSDNGGTLHIQDVLRNYNVETSAVSLTITTINASGNLSVGGNVGLFGNTTHGRVGAGSGAFHTFVGNITQTSSGGAVYINTTGNVLATGGIFNALTVNGTAGVTTLNATTLTATGNIIAGLAQFAAINSTPIGNATASTGAFTTLTATSVNSSGNVLATGLTVFGNVVHAGGRRETGYQFSASTANVAVTALPTKSRLLLTPTGAIISFGANVTLPGGNVDGATYSISSNVATTLAVYGQDGVSVSPGANVQLTAGTSVSYLYYATDNKWYKIS